MTRDPNTPDCRLIAWLFALAMLGCLAGCAIEWSTRQRIDWFSRDHTNHQTNAVETVP